MGVSPFGSSFRSKADHVVHVVEKVVEKEVEKVGFCSNCLNQLTKKGGEPRSTAPNPNPLNLKLLELSNILMPMLFLLDILIALHLRAIN